MSRFDVVVIGEVLVELYCEEPLADGAGIRLGFSGDALNAAAAAVAAGARTAILTAVGEDEVGDAIIHRITELGVHAELIRRSSRPNGAYLLHGDLSGRRQFSYWRTGSAASTVDNGDIGRLGATIAAAGALVLTGITAALSDTAEAAALTAAELAASHGVPVVYDPNFRPRLTSKERAAAVLRRVAPHCALLTPSSPGDTDPLLGNDDPAGAALALGARAVAITSGPDPVLLADAGGRRRLPVPVNEHAVDATGAGDVFTGTVAARLAIGDPLVDAVVLGIGASSLSVGGRGGTGYIPSLDASRAAAG